MSGFFVWLPDAPRPDSAAVATSLAHALRVHDRQGTAWWHADELVVGVLELGTDADVAARYAPVSSADGTRLFWLVGEVYAADQWADVSASTSRTASFRRRVAAACDTDASATRTMRALDGDFVAMQWDRRTHTLTLWTDRFGSIPVFRGAAPGALVLASGVRGVLAAPGMRTDPDVDALREAVSYGGFRLGARTNVRAASLLGAAQCLVASTSSPPATQRWWHWRDIPPQHPRSMTQAVEELHSLWRDAVSERLDGLARPGQTLSGGLDSRAILAEAAPRLPAWHALTYGIAGCDDARIAERAARAVGASWTFMPLYRGGDPAWLDERLSHVQHTDGLIELGDLMHAEALPWVRQHTDALVSGYIGDAVIGPTFNAIATPGDVLAALPYYGGALGEPEESARARAEGMLAVLGGAAARFALFDDKLPQSTNFCHGALWRPYVRVRRPFLANRFFEFAQGLTADWRNGQRLQAHWLRHCYPALFTAIPNQKTGVPLGAPRWQWQLARARRVAARTTRRLLATAGVPLAPRSRNFTDDASAWRAPGPRAQIRSLLLAPDALHHGVFSVGAVAQVLGEWERDAAAPAQVIGALVVFEHYHRGLAAHLAAARSAGRTPRAPSGNLPFADSAPESTS